MTAPPGAASNPRSSAKGVAIGAVLDHLERQHRIETLAGLGDRFGGGEAIVDFETGALRVRPRRLDRFGARIDGGHPKAEARHRLGHEAAAAPDVEQGQPGKRLQLSGIAAEMRQQPRADETEPGRIEPVQRAEAALGVPPRIGLRGKAHQFLVIDGGAACEHGLILPLRPFAGWLDRSERSMWSKSQPGNGSNGVHRDMARLVQKYGGTSLADVERINNVARRVGREVEAGNEIAVVVSAMAGVTNQLVDWTREMSRLHDAREYDVVVSSGEQVTAGLLSLALQNLGVDARSWLGWQIPIRTDGVHGKARIEAIEVDEVSRRLARGQVAVVAGFQGIDQRGRITTLGRGGSDTSAVALAAALKADRCDIFTDVDGVYTSDPRIVASARKLGKITYEEMLEMASQGAKVLQTRSVEMAMNHRVRVQVLSSFVDSPGTLVVDEDEIVEHQVVSGIAYSRDEAKITVQKVADRPGVAAAIFGPLADNAINVDMIVQNMAEDGRADLTFTVARADLERAVSVLEERRGLLGFAALRPDSNVVKISVIGVGMRSHAGVAKQMFQTLSEKGINIQVISTSEIKVSVLIAAEYTELALRALHTAYGLDAVG